MGQKVAKALDGFGRIEKQVGAGWRPLSVGDVVPETTTVRTGDNAALLLQLPDGHRVRIGEKTTVTLSKLGQDKNFTLKVVSGQLWTLVRKASQPRSFRVETPSAVAGVTGTLFCVALDEETGETLVDTGEGSVEVNPLGEERKRLPIRAGFFVRVPGKHKTQEDGPERVGGVPPGTLAGMTFSALAHKAENRAMWQKLRAEGDWLRQDGRGPMRLQRGREADRRRWWADKHSRQKPPRPAERWARRGR